MGTIYLKDVVKGGNDKSASTACGAMGIRTS